MTEQRLADQASIIRTNGIRRDKEKNFDNFDNIASLQQRKGHEIKMAQWSPVRLRYMYVENEITDEERLIIDELKVLMTRNETEEYLPFKKVDQRKLRDVIKKVNAEKRHIETDAITQTKKLPMTAAL